MNHQAKAFQAPSYGRKEGASDYPPPGEGPRVLRRFKFACVQQGRTRAVGPTEQLCPVEVCFALCVSCSLAACIGAEMGSELVCWYRKRFQESRPCCLVHRVAVGLHFIVRLAANENRVSV